MKNDYGKPHSIVLIACCGQKRAEPGPARELYTSPLFRNSVAWAEAKGYPWYVLSALHGLVQPDQLLEPYDLTLSQLRSLARRDWAERVMGQIQAELKPGPLIMLAGKRYRRELAPLLWAAGHDVEVPMQGMAIGQQLGWLKQQLQRLSEADPVTQGVHNG